MIIVENLTKRFGQHTAVKNVSFSVQKGETLGLLGPNGAGKTTIMRMMTGYLPPSEGRVIINDMDMFEQPDEVKKRIGYLPEHPPLYMDMTVMECLTFISQIQGVKGSNIKHNIEEAAELCSVSHMLGRLTGNLSKGYRQRVGLAQALVHRPDILILDEPTVGLDPEQIIEIRELIINLGRDKTVILSSHLLQEITSVCKKVAIINNGELIVCDSIDRLSEDMNAGQRIVINVSDREKVDLEKLRGLPHVVKVGEISGGRFVIDVEEGYDIRREVSSLLAGMGTGLLEMNTEALSLEEIFLRVVKGE
jgi:ABC-2 type transport system ATP-binding protein